MHDLSMMYGSQEDVTSLVKSTERVSSPCDAQDYDLPIVASEQDIMPIYLCLELTIDGKHSRNTNKYPEERNVTVSVPSSTPKQDTKCVNNKRALSWENTVV
ncbi:hypothetical protein C0Q70_16958 [Pomacea canaliculata]|uniref:Uncharacterized protein n=1 Tax=Pomacea canaliculata TaxID=400727 RepID=A0A2T7NR82_POMCA|nr:hypothetical protein C0Q70_16958 [Pomacea canaliculata]